MPQYTEKCPNWVFCVPFLLPGSLPTNSFHSPRVWFQIWRPSSRHENNVGQTMPCLPSKNGTGKFIPPIFDGFLPGGWCNWFLLKPHYYRTSLGCRWLHDDGCRPWCSWSMPTWTTSMKSHMYVYIYIDFFFIWLKSPVTHLVGGLEHVLFFHILGRIIPTDFHIFSEG